MEYILFSYPNCPVCEALKKYLLELSFKVAEYSLVLKESKLKIRSYLKVLKRDKTGAIIVPTLILQQEGKVSAVLNNREELEEWLKSKG